VSVSRGIELGTAYLSLVADTRNLARSARAGLGQVEAEADRTGKSAGSRLGGGVAKGVGVIAAGVAGLTAVVGGLAITGGISRALNIEDAQAKLKGLGHSTDSVKAIMTNALASVKGTAFGMGDAASVAASAVAAGVKPGQDLERTLKLVADASTIAGTDMGEMGLIFNKVATTNKVQGEVIQQLGERGIPIIQLLAKELGLTAEQTVKLASDGKINFDTFRNAMEAGMGGAALKSGETTRGAFKNMLAALSRIGEQLISGVFPMVAGFFMGITGMLDRIGPAAAVAGQWLGDVVSRVGATLAGLFQLLRTGDFTGELRAALGVEEDSPIVAGVLWLRDTALGAFAEVRGGVAAMFAAFRDGGSDVTSSGFAGILETVGLVARSIWDALGPAIQSLGPTLLELWQTFSPLGIILQVLEPILPTLADALVRVGSALGGALAVALPVIVDLIGTLATVLSGVLAQVLPIIADLFILLVGAVADMLPVLGPVLTLLGDALGSVLMALAPVLGMVVEILADGLAAVLPVLAPLLGLVAQVIASVLSVVMPLVPAVLSLVKAFLPLLPVVAQLVMALLPPVVMLIGALLPVVTTVAGLLVKLLVPAIQFVATILGFLVGVIANVIGWLAGNLMPTITAVWNGIAAGATWLYENIFKPVWNGIQTVISVAWSIISVVFDLMQMGWRLLALGFKIIWDTVLAPVWAVVQTVIGAVWGWIDQNVFTPMKVAWALVGAAFAWVKDNVIAPVWSGLQTILSAAWSWISTNVFEPFKAGVSLIGAAFELVKDTISRAWDGLKEIAAKPVNFILGTVYNDGIREWWNKLAGAVGMDSLLLPKASLVQFASGGVLPGYTPGRDVHQFYSPTGGRLALSGGEAIMRPEFTRAVGGPAGVARLNMMARKGQAFKNGGVFDFFGDAWDTVKGIGKGIWDAAGMAVEVVKDPLGAIKKAVVDGIIAPLMAKVGVDGDFVKILTQLPVKFAGGLADKVKSMFDSQASTMANGTPGSGVGLGRMGQMLQAVLPGARVTSGFRAGARTAGFGAVSFHALGRALDIGAGGGRSLSQIWDVLNAAYGSQSQELLYTPKGANQILRGGKRGGTSGVTAANHYDHVHWAMKNGGVIPGLYDNGGWMNPGDIGVNLTRKPEAVLDPEESAALKAGNFGGPMIGELHVHDGQDAVREFESLRRRQATQARLGAIR
jgi:tape measure domain-containing protein